MIPIIVTSYFQTEVICFAGKNASAMPSARGHETRDCPQT